MPKHDFFSPKAIANRQKSVGLQRLRWYCQMCQKQCRDENGFKCHTMSEGHLRQMRLFAENPSSFLDDFSREFERGYLNALSRGHGTKRVLANKVYQEYIADKNHVHMNATVWTTLTGFIMHLGREGKAVVDETEKGWFIQYIDRDPKTIARQHEREARQSAQLTEEEVLKREIQLQMEMAERKARERELEDSNTKAGEREMIEGQDGDMSGTEKPAVMMALAPATATKTSLKRKLAQQVGIFAAEEEDAEEGTKIADDAEHKRLKFEKDLLIQRGSKRMSNLERIILENQRESQPSSHGSQPARSMPSEINEALAPEVWVRRGLIVKITHGKCSGSKAVVEDVSRRGRDVSITVTLLDSPCTQLCDLALSDIQTVVPKVGELGMMVRGKHAGEMVVVEAIRVDDYCCDVHLAESRQSISNVEYEDICKLSKQTKTSIEYY